MGIWCDAPVYILGDNQLVFCNTTIPGPVLKKKAGSIAYHFTCEGAAQSGLRMAEAGRMGMWIGKVLVWTETGKVLV